MARVTAEGSATFVAPAARVAVFDNDGTLWCERPTYAQALFLLERLREQAAADPALADQPVVRALLAGDLGGAFAMGAEAVGPIVLATHAGWTVDEYSAAVTAWLARTRHSRFGVTWPLLVYRPMLELLDLLRANAFRVFIVTGGGVEFVRSFAEAAYGVPPDDVVGTAVEVEVERRAGRMVLVRRPVLVRGFVNEGEPKPRLIQAHVGVRPIFAAGNSAGDAEMLEFASTGPLPSLAILIDHDDAEREYAYESRAATDPGADPILETAARLGWTVVSMRRDWSVVFGA